MYVLDLDEPVTKTQLFDAWVELTICSFFNIKYKKEVKGKIQQIDYFKADLGTVYTVWVTDCQNGRTYAAEIQLS